MTQLSQEPTVRPPLRRSKTDRVFAGVCGGLARTLGIDPIIVRVLAVALVLAGGAGLFAYVIAWILIPEENGTSVIENARGGSKSGKFFIAVLLAIAGLAIVSSITGNNSFVGVLLLALVLIGLSQAFGWFGESTPPGSP